MKIKQLALVGLPALVLGLLIGNLWWNPTTKAYFDPAYWAGIGKVGEAMRLIHFRYADEEKASFEDLSESSVSLMVNNLDKHSRYMSEADFNDYKLSSKRQYFGIGVTIFKVEDRIMVTRVFPGGGAETAEIHAGDRIMAVDSTQLADVSVSQASKLIQGNEGTKVTLRLEDAKGAHREVEVLRGKIQLASVEGIRMIDETGYLRIDQFTSLTGEEFDSAMTVLNESGMRFLVVDLRSNGGGLLMAAVKVLSHFFEKDEVVVSIEGRNRPGGMVYRSSGKNSVGCPVVVLINSGSASASEIVAGALQVSGKALLVGDSSYGKGSVQRIFPLDDESGIRLTTARYFLPGGVGIGEDGLSPDIEVECDDETWRKLLLQRDQSPFADLAAFEYRFGFQPVEDPQLEMALCVLWSADGVRLKEAEAYQDDLPNP